MKNLLFSILILTLVGCSKENEFETFEEILFTSNLIYNIDSIEISIPAEKILDSVKETNIKTKDSLHHNLSNINELQQYAKKIESEKMTYELIKREGIRNKQVYDPKILKQQYNGYLKNSQSIACDIYTNKDREVVLISISDGTKNQRVYEDFIFKEGRIVFIKKVLIESKSTGWEHVSQNEFKLSYLFSNQGLMVYTKNDIQNFPSRETIEETYYNKLKKIGNKEYLTSTYLLRIAQDILNNKKVDCYNKKIRISESKSEIESIFNGAIKLDISNFGRLRPLFTAIINIDKHGKISNCKIQTMYLNKIKPDNEDVIEKMIDAFNELHWIPAQSKCTNYASEMRIHYRYDGFGFKF